MRWPAARFAALMVVAALFGTAMACSAVAAAQVSEVGALNGRIGATNRGGGVVPPKSATVFVLFSSALDRDTRAGTALADLYDFNTAGGQFGYHLNNLLGKNKDLKSLTKSARHNPRPEDADQIAAYYLDSVDEALTRVRSWLTKHSNRSWQMKTVTPDAQGFWSAEALRPGRYEVVVRGALPGYDADWEASVDLGANKTITVPLTRPRFSRHEQR